MYIIKVLKRKDAASVIVAVVLALVLSSVVTALTGDFANYLSGVSSELDGELRDVLIRPLVSAFLQVLTLEVFLRLVIFARPAFVRKKK